MNQLNLTNVSDIQINQQGSSLFAVKHNPVQILKIDAESLQVTGAKTVSFPVGKIFYANGDTIYLNGFRISSYNFANGAARPTSLSVDLAVASQDGATLYTFKPSSLERYSWVGFSLARNDQTTVPVSSDYPLLITKSSDTLFLRNYRIDTSLDHKTTMLAPALAISAEGEIAISTGYVFAPHWDEVLGDLPFLASMAAISGDQRKIMVYQSDGRQLAFIDSAPFSRSIGTVINPMPENGGFAFSSLQPAPLLRWTEGGGNSYQVYFGTNSAMVVAATPSDPSFVGSAKMTNISLSERLEKGETYFWRVDQVGFLSTNNGPVWSFIHDVPAETIGLTFGPDNFRISGPPGARLKKSYRMNRSFGANPRPWTLQSSQPWLQFTPSNGVTPTDFSVTVDAREMPAGTTNAVVTLTSDLGAVQINAPIELIQPYIVQLLTDYERGVIYGVDIANGGIAQFNGLAGNIENFLAVTNKIGRMDDDPSKNVLYVITGHPSIHQIDLDTFTLLSAKAYPGSPAAVIAAGTNSNVFMANWNSSLGEYRTIDQFNHAQGLVTLSLNDGNRWIRGLATSPDGSYLHALFIGSWWRTYDLVEEKWLPPALTNSFPITYDENWHHLMVSEDGTKVFSRNYVYNPFPQPKITKRLFREAFAISRQGGVAFGTNYAMAAEARWVYGSYNAPSSIMSLSTDEKQLFSFDPASRKLVAISTDQVANVINMEITNSLPNGSLLFKPYPALRWSESFALSYDIYLGTNATEVENATFDSELYLGRVVTNTIALPQDLTPGTTYYWRVDQIGFNTHNKGDEIWSFVTSNFSVDQDPLQLTSFNGLETENSPIAINLFGSNLSWSAVENISWLTLSQTSGSGSAIIIPQVDTTGLTNGEYEGIIHLTVGSFQYDLKVTLARLGLQITKMLTDYRRPYIYAIQAPLNDIDGRLLFISTLTGTIETSLPIGRNPVDLTIGESKLYVADFGSATSPVVNLESRTLTTPLPLGTNVYRINAVRTNQLYVEPFNGKNIFVFNASTGEPIETIPSHYAGDGEADPTGTWYYHADPQLTRVYAYKVHPGVPSVWHQTPNLGVNNRNLILSHDGSRLFWQGLVLSSNLSTLKTHAPIYSANHDGSIIATATHVLESDTGETWAPIPVPTTVSAFSANGQKFFYYDSNAQNVRSILLWDDPKLNITHTQVDGNNFVMTVSGDSGQAFAVESSSNLQTWDQVTTGELSPGASTVQIQISQSGSATFFRLTLL
ncbi:MAG: YncE family protein [Verrucomicrobiales bacterium]